MFGMTLEKVKENKNYKLVEWDGKNDEDFDYVASGLYLVHIEFTNLKDTKKIMLAK